VGIVKYVVGPRINGTGVAKTQLPRAQLYLSAVCQVSTSDVNLCKPLGLANRSEVTAWGARNVRC